RAQLLPEREAWIVLVQAPEDAVCLIVRVTDFEQPVLVLLLEMQAVLQGIGAPGILVEPLDALTQIGHGAERGTGRPEDAAAERVRQRVGGGEKVILRGDQRRRPAEAVLTGGDLKSRLREAAESAADDGVRPNLVGEADARLPFVVVAVDDCAGLSVDAGKKLCAVNLESARGGYLGQLLHDRVIGVCGQ